MSRRTPDPGPPPTDQAPAKHASSGGSIPPPLPPSPQGSHYAPPHAPPAPRFAVETTAPEVREPATTHQRPSIPDTRAPEVEPVAVRPRARPDARPALPASPFRPPATPTEFERALGRARYVADTPTVLSLWLALRLDRPLLIEGPAGVGKT